MHVKVHIYIHTYLLFLTSKSGSTKITVKDEEMRKNESQNLFEMHIYNELNAEQNGTYEEMLCKN